MMIQHNVYKDGTQDIHFTTGEGQDVAVSVFMQGHHDFGQAQKTTRITILTGKLIDINGRKFMNGSGSGNLIIFQQGEIVKFDTTSGTSCICYYD